MDYGKISLFFTKVDNFSLDFIIYEYRKSIESDCILEMDTANQSRNRGEDGDIKGKRHPLWTIGDLFRQPQTVTNVIN